MSSNFIGKFSNYSPTFVNTIDKRLNRVGMNYLTPEDKTPHGPVSWVPEEHNFQHPFSLLKRAKDYGYHKLSDLMPLDVYLNMPADSLDTVIEGIRLGAEQRLSERPKEEEIDIDKEIAAQLNGKNK